MTQAPPPDHRAAQGWLAAAIIWIVVVAALAVGPPRSQQAIRLVESRICP